MTDVQRLEDQQAIRDLMSTYALGIDTKDWTLFGTCFVDEAVAEYKSIAKHGFDMPPIRGREALRAGGAVAFAPLTTQHYLVNPLVTVRGDRADFASHVLALHVDDATQKVYAQSGRYAVEAVRTPEGWRIEHLVHSEVYAFGDPQVILAPLAAF